MWIELGAAAWLIGDAIYHEVKKAYHSKPVPPSTEIQIPIIDVGAVVPMLFGRYRVRRPLLVWAGEPSWDEIAVDDIVVRHELRMELFYVLGIGFPHGNGITSPLAENRIHTFYAGDHSATGGLDGEVVPANRLLSALTGNGGNENPVHAMQINERGAAIVSDVEFLNGHEVQVLVNSGASTYTGAHMLAAGLVEKQIPGYRGLLSVFMFQGEGGANHGNVSAIPAYHFEASSYHTSHGDLGTYCRVGDDSNPINALYCLLTNPPGLGGLGFDPSRINISSFQTAQYKLHTETHGYSCCIDEQNSAEEVIHDLLIQIDGLLYEEPTTGEIAVKLIRADYNTSELLEINTGNCVRLEGFVMGGNENLINKVTIIYADRESDYKDNSVSLQNPGSIGGNVFTKEMQVRLPGVTSTDLASRIAGRILTTLSRPLIKCRAIVGGEFMRVRPGDVVRLNYRNPDISNIPMRVLGVELGTLEDDDIYLDLVQDAAYVWRGSAPKPAWEYDGPLGEIFEIT